MSLVRVIGPGRSRLRAARENSGMRMGDIARITGDRVSFVSDVERGKHSRKPDEAFDVFESVSPGPRLELFSRRPRDGWSVWGEEV